MTTVSRRFALWCASVGGIVLLICLGVSCVDVQRTVRVMPTIEGAAFVGNKSCAECHTNISRAFASSVHSRIHRDDLRLIGGTGCESCHGAGSKHIAAGGGRGRFIINPRQDPAICMDCHLDVRGMFNLPHHHPVPEGKMNCAQCHDPHGMDIFKPGKGLGLARINENCSSCHRDQTRPFVFEHGAMRDGCTACHTPHGSIASKMLVQRDANLCLRCHAQVKGTGGAASLLFIGKVPHDALMNQGTCWSAGCHSAVHGSNMSSKLRY